MKCLHVYLVSYEQASRMAPMEFTTTLDIMALRSGLVYENQTVKSFIVDGLEGTV